LARIKVSVYTDCRDATNTRCRLPLTVRVDVADTTNTNTNLDLLKKATLRKGQTYTKAVVVAPAGATVAQGNISGGAETIRFRSPVDGSVYVRVGEGYLYSLTPR
jgi:hypothetical protein